MHAPSPPPTRGENQRQPGLKEVQIAIKVHQIGHEQETRDSHPHR